MTILSLVGAASSATSLEYKIVFEMLGVLLLLLLLLRPLPLLPSLAVVAGNPGWRGFGLWTVSSKVSQRYTLHYRVYVYRMPQTKYASFHCRAYILTSHR